MIRNKTKFRMDTDEEFCSYEEAGISEQDLIEHVDILFRTSDVDGTGYVPVSHIIEYLRIHTSFGESEDDLSFLVRLADPRGGNPSLTLEQYREIMWEWIKQLQQGSRDGHDGGSEYDEILTESASLGSSQSLHNSPKDRGVNSDHGFSKQDDQFGPQQYFGASSEEVQQYLDQIQELLFQNNKLTEENSTLQQQIYSQEEALTQSNASNEGLSKKIKSLQEGIQVRQQQESENEDLILKLQDQKQEMHKKMSNLTSDLEHLRASNRELETNIVEYQHHIEQLSEIKRNQEIQLSERFEELRNQQNQILSLSGSVQELKIEREELKHKLNQSNEAIESLKQEIECKEKGDDLGRFPCSTPIKRNNSICMELRGMLEEGDHMMSPLCDKELDRMEQVLPIFSSDEEGVEESDPNISLYSVSLKDDLTLDMSKFMEKYQRKQESLLDEIRHFLKPGNITDDGTYPKEFLGKVQEQMAKLWEKVSILAQAKTDVDRRLCRQKKKFRRLKEQNAVLKDAADDVMENKASWDTVTDKRLLILKDQIDQERANIKFLEKKLKDKESKVFIDKNNKSGAERVLKMEIHKLQSLNKDLTERNRKLEGKVSGLVEEVTKAHQDIESKQAVVKELQAERDKLKVEKERAQHQLNQRTRQAPGRNVLKVLTKQGAQYQFSQGTRQDANCHIRIQESKLREDQSLSCLHNTGTGDADDIAQMSGILPFDLLPTQGHDNHKESQLKQLSSQNNSCIQNTDGEPKGRVQGSDHLWMDRGRQTEGNYPALEGEGEERDIDCVYKGGGRRRYSYQAAIDNHSCPPGEQHYPRYRSGSFQAAIEGSQKGEEPEEGTQEETPDSSRVLDSSVGESFQSSTSVYGYFQPGGDHLSSNKLSSCHGSSSYGGHHSAAVCYSVCDSVRYAGRVGCGGDFTVNSSYRTCTDTSHNHCGVNMTPSASGACDVTDGDTAIRERVGSDGHYVATDKLTGCGDGHFGHCVATGGQINKGDEQFGHCNTTDRLTDCDNGQFGTEWRERMDNSNSTVEDSSLSHRSDNFSGSPEAPDVIQITKSGKGTAGCSRPLMKPLIESHLSSSSSAPTAESKSSPDLYTCNDHMETLDVPSSKETTNTISEDDSSEKGSEVKGSESEVKGANVKDKDRTEVKVKSKDVIEKKEGNENNENGDENDDEDDDDGNVLVTSNLIEQMEKLNLSDTSGSCDMSAGDSKFSPHLKKIRQGNLAKRREQMKFLRMPDLNEMQESGQTMTNGDGESENPVMPSISQSLLQDLGVDQDNPPEDSPDQLSEHEIENKFTSLSLAFKTDKITLEKRLEIQERSRDIAEENVAKEIKGLREALEQLNQICVDSQVRDLLLKIQKHITVLEQASARVSSRAEVFGAVQQEKRMSKAIEIMLTHVDNLRLSHERQTAELEEARKLIQDNRPFGGSSEIGDFGGLSRRSASVCQGTAFLPKGTRRRVSDVSLTRSGLPHSMSMDPRAKFKQLATTAANANVAIRKASLSKQTSTSSLLGGNLRLSQDSNHSDSKSTGTNSKQHSVEEEAFQKGFEQGYKAQITGQLKQLRDQQNSITDTLEELRDKCDEEDEDKGPQQEVSLRDTVLSLLWENIPPWETASHKLRLATVFFFLFMAAISIVLSFFPVGYAAVQVQPDYQHVKAPPV
uniref:Uncharacterized protein LOC111100631 isoform X2 n=1 Tax=Crassostrea virginica TaxID=6565 RepID=A0A8B8AB67_CRAVI|nr:uncharacterized protein LOC111100631 isoform X2 [Crassostrea virginica]